MVNLPRQVIGIVRVSAKSSCDKFFCNDTRVSAMCFQDGRPGKLYPDKAESRYGDAHLSHYRKIGPSNGSQRSASLGVREASGCSLLSRNAHY